MAASIRRIGRAALRAFIAALALSPLGAALGNEQRQIVANDQPMIQVDTESAVERAPDLAVVTLGVTGDAPDDRTALARHSENLLRLLATIRAAGVNAKDVEQARPFVEPVYESWVEDGREQSGARIGFRATTTITLTLRDMTRAGRTIQTVVQGGANIIERIEFKLKDERHADARAEARAAAISLAKRLALRSARASGGTDVRLVSVGEPPPPDGQADLYVPPEPREFGVPLIVEPGTLQISEKVRATFRLVP